MWILTITSRLPNTCDRNWRNLKFEQMINRRTTFPAYNLCKLCSKIRDPVNYMNHRAWCETINARRKSYCRARNKDWLFSWDVWPILRFRSLRNRTDELVFLSMYFAFSSNGIFFRNVRWYNHVRCHDMVLSHVGSHIDISHLFYESSSVDQHRTHFMWTVHAIKRPCIG